MLLVVLFSLLVFVGFCLLIKACLRKEPFEFDMTDRAVKRLRDYIQNNRKRKPQGLQGDA